MTVFLILPLPVFSSEEELRIIDERISQIEQRLEIIKGKEKEYDDITRELGRAKYNEGKGIKKEAGGIEKRAGTTS